MSWQRIIEVARKQGMPVIVTDVAGREPMVLMPLNGYERLLDGATPPSTDEKPLYVAKNAVPKPPTPSSEPVLAVPVTVTQPVPASEPPPAPLSPPSEPPVTNPDSLRRRQRDGDRVEMLHRSLDTVSQVVAEGGPTPKQVEADLLSEERFSFQS